MKGHPVRTPNDEYVEGLYEAAPGLSPGLTGIVIIPTVAKESWKQKHRRTHQKGARLGAAYCLLPVTSVLNPQQVSKVSSLWRIEQSSVREFGKPDS